MSTRMAGDKVRLKRACLGYLQFTVFRELKLPFGLWYDFRRKPP